MFILIIINVRSAPASLPPGIGEAANANATAYAPAIVPHPTFTAIS